MFSNPVRMKTVGRFYKPRFVAMKRESVRQAVTLHKRRVRHAAKQYLKTGILHDLNRMSGMITDWDFD
jgi:3-dehydroquinate synthetase